MFPTTAITVEQMDSSHRLHNHTLSHRNTFENPYYPIWITMVIIQWSPINYSCLTDSADLWQRSSTTDVVLFVQKRADSRMHYFIMSFFFFKWRLKSLNNKITCACWHLMSRIILICQSDWKLLEFNESGKKQVCGRKQCVCVCVLVCLCACVCDGESWIVFHAAVSWYVR